MADEQEVFLADCRGPNGLLSKTGVDFQLPGVHIAHERLPAAERVVEGPEGLPWRNLPGAFTVSSTGLWISLGLYDHHVGLGRLQGLIGQYRQQVV
jgi:hypothetical protein